MKASTLIKFLVVLGSLIASCVFTYKAAKAGLNGDYAYGVYLYCVAMFFRPGPELTKETIKELAESA